MNLLSWLKTLATTPELEPGADGDLGPEEVRHLFSSGVVSIAGALDCTFRPDGHVHWDEGSGPYEIGSDGLVRYKFASFRLARRKGRLVIKSRSPLVDGLEVDWRGID